MPGEFSLFIIGNVAIGSVAYLHLVMLLLLPPALVFVAAVKDAAGDPAPVRPRRRPTR